MKLFVLFSLSLLLIGCRVELEEGQEADLSLTWACTYKLGKVLQCPGKAKAVIQGKISDVTNAALGTDKNAVAQAIVSGGVGLGMNALIPAPINKGLDCVELAGDGICKLVKLANKDKITVGHSSSQKNRKSLRTVRALRLSSKSKKIKPQRPQYLKPGIYTLTIQGSVYNEPSSSVSSYSSEGSSSSIGNR